MKSLNRISKSRAFAHARILAAVLLVVAATALAFDVSPALRNLPRVARPLIFPPGTLIEVRERGPEGPMAHRVKPHSPDGALQLFSHPLSPKPSIPAPLLTFEGLSNLDNFNVFGFRVNPPDPNGEVGPNNYVEIINLVFGVYDKA